MTRHDLITSTDIHIIYFKTYADQTAMNADATLVETDEGKICWVTGDNTFHALVDYSTPTWIDLSGGGAVAGADTQVQYNNAGAFGASGNFVFDHTTNSFIFGVSHVNTSNDKVGIFGGESNQILNAFWSGILGGSFNVIDGDNNSVIVGGNLNRVDGNTQSGKVSGQNNDADGCDFSDIGGLDHVLVDVLQSNVRGFNHIGTTLTRVNIAGSQFNVTGATDSELIGSDSGGTYVLLTPYDNSVVIWERQVFIGDPITMGANNTGALLLIPGTTNPVIFNAEDFDATSAIYGAVGTGIYDPVTGIATIPANMDGRYIIKASITIDPDPLVVAGCDLNIMVGGVAVDNHSATAILYTDYPYTFRCEKTFEIAGGTAVQIQFVNNTTRVLSSPGGTSHASFSIHKIS